jgi:hypothetical protein
MADLTDMELLARIDMTRSAILEMEGNMVSLKEDLTRYLDALTARKGVGTAGNENLHAYKPKLDRLYNYITDFTCSEMPKKTASYRFVSVPTYREACGMARPDPLEYRIDEENNVHMTITFYVSTDRIRNFLTKWWQMKFKNLAYVGFYPAGHDW